MKEEPPAKPRRLRLGKLHWWVLALALAICARAAWREYDYQNAVREAKAAGLTWTCTEPTTLIRQDWNNALKKETWSTNVRSLGMGEGHDLGRYRDLIHRLRPTMLLAIGCKDENLDALKGLTSLKVLSIGSNDALQNVDSLKGLTSLQNLSLGNCATLQNLDGLNGLTRLQNLFLFNCPALQDIGGLKGLTCLQNLFLTNCPTLKNVDTLKGLPSLNCIDFNHSLRVFDSPEPGKPTHIPDTALRELRAALPTTAIILPDGTLFLPE